MRVWEAKMHYSLRSPGESKPLNLPVDVVDYLKDAFDEDPTVEWFYAIPLDSKNRPLGRQIVSRGTANTTLAHPREVFKAAILLGATGVVIGHNHPSGDPTPSASDIQTTRKLREAGLLLDIPLRDHVIIGHAEADPLGHGYYSFCASGLVIF